MAVVKYDKLVRDLIPEIIEKDGKKVNYYQITEPDKHKKALENKLCEEILEYLNDPNIEELADIQEVIDCLDKLFYNGQLADVKAKKCKERGSFIKGYILKEVEE